MQFDYEAAWADLLGLLEADPRPNWGARQLRDEMGRTLARHRVNEAGMAQMLRLYGVQVDTTLRVDPSTTGPTPAGIGDPAATAESGDSHRQIEGDHDGRREHPAAHRAGEGRGRSLARS